MRALAGSPAKVYGGYLGGLRKMPPLSTPTKERDPMKIQFERGMFRDVIAVSQAPSKPRKAKAKTDSMATGGDIPTSGALTGIEIRVQKLLMRDNGTTWVWPWIRYSDLYVVMVAIDNLGGAPYRVALEGFAKVDDGETLPVERTAYLWQKDGDHPKAPNQVHMVVSVIKSNSGIRKTGALLSKLKGTDDYRTAVGSLVGAVASSGATAIVDGLIAVTSIVGGILEGVDDQPLLTQVLSFTGINGDFDSLGKHLHQKGNKFVDLEVALTVRDAARDLSP